jgi:hypothetical protein
MNILGFDTATPETAVGLLNAAGEQFEARDELAAGERGAHAERVLVLSRELLSEAGLAWTDLQVIAVGVGPGGYTSRRGPSSSASARCGRSPSRSAAPPRSRSLTRVAASCSLPPTWMMWRCFHRA